MNTPLIPSGRKNQTLPLNIHHFLGGGGRRDQCRFALSGVGIGYWVLGTAVRLYPFVYILRRMSQHTMCDTTLLLCRKIDTAQRVCMKKRNHKSSFIHECVRHFVHSYRNMVTDAAPLRRVKQHNALESGRKKNSHHKVVPFSFVIFCFICSFFHFFIHSFFFLSFTNSFSFFYSPIESFSLISCHIISYLGDIASGPEDLDVLHKLCGAVLGVQHRQLRENARVSLLQTKALEQQQQQPHGESKKVKKIRQLQNTGK